MDGLASLNQATAAEAEAALFRCCGCAGWARAVSSARPFPDREALLFRAETEWARASKEDILEAFSHHPRIGEREGPSKATTASATEKWSAAEQAKVSEADEKTLADLLAANQAYEARFGHIFIVCASGKTAGEMLGLLNGRLANDPERELGIAAAEQMKITRLRIDKLLSEGLAPGRAS